VLQQEELARSIIGAAIEVHKALGPGLLESVYESCLCCELELRKLQFQRQVELPVIYKGRTLNCDYRLDIVLKTPSFWSSRQLRRCCESMKLSS
jgi:GxxExxY protein